MKPIVVAVHGSPTSAAALRWAADQAAVDEGTAWAHAQDECGLLDAVDLDEDVTGSFRPRVRAGGRIQS